MRAFYVDAELADELFGFLEEKESRTKKFAYCVERVVNNQTTRDIYEKESIHEKIVDVYALKMFKGGENIRIYCRQFSLEDEERIVIVACELLKKKKSQKLNAPIKSIINRIAAYDYEFS